MESRAIYPSFLILYSVAFLASQVTTMNMAAGRRPVCKTICYITLPVFPTRPTTFRILASGLY